MYADKVTVSMRAAMDETDRRRTIQHAYNQEHGITPQSIIKAIDDVMSSVYERDYMTPSVAREATNPFRTQAEVDAHIAKLRAEMKSAAANLDFEKAASLRDEIKRLRAPELGLPWPARRA
jgi:excinuclease ABC subunit B